MPLGTFEEEEASGVPTDDLAFVTRTAAPERGVTSVGVSWHPFQLTVGREVRVMRLEQLLAFPEPDAQATSLGCGFRWAPTEGGRM